MKMDQTQVTFNDQQDFMNWLQTHASPQLHETLTDAPDAFVVGVQQLNMMVWWKLE